MTDNVPDWSWEIHPACTDADYLIEVIVGVDEIDPVNFNADVVVIRDGVIAWAATFYPVKPRAHRPDRDIERESDLLVAEVSEGEEEQCIPLLRAHRRESTCQPSVESGTVDSRSRLVLMNGPLVDAAATVRP